MANCPTILSDRTPVEVMQINHPIFLKRIRELKIGKVDNKETVHFCGVAWAGREDACAFVPRQSLTEDSSRSVEVAKMTMKVLAQYGRDMVGRTGIGLLGSGNASLISVIRDLVSDFLTSGTYVERMRVQTRNSGKPDWYRTVVRENAFIGSNDKIIYPNVRSTKAIDSSEHLLAQIQLSVLSEIAQHHSWWLDGLAGCEAELKRYPPPSDPRRIWVQKLRGLLPQLYAVRAINLANDLIAYLEDRVSKTDGTFLYGVEDFHSVWEHMLRCTLQGVEVGWNSRLPRPAYVRCADGLSDSQERGMQTDIVLRHGEKLVVVDAKYYDAVSVTTSPGWPDIVKQLFYEMAVASVAGGEPISGCFVFPARENNKGPFAQVNMVHRDGTEATEFPQVICRYLDVFEVMRAYVRGSKIALELH